MNRTTPFAAAIGLAGLALAGCTTNSVVATTKVDGSLTADGLGDRTAYLPYFLPQSVFVVTMKKAGGGGDDKKDAPSTVTNTINIQGGAAKVEKKADAPDPKKAACDALRESYDKQRDAQTMFVAEWPNRRAALEAIAAGNLKTPKQQKAARAAFAALRADILKANIRVAEAKRLATGLKEACPTRSPSRSPSM